MPGVRIHPDAEVELRESALFYEEQGSGLGLRFLEEYRESRRLAQKHPYRWPRDRGGTRRVRLNDFPFSIFYQIEATAIYIVAVVHHSRAPGYWKDRLR